MLEVIVRKRKPSIQTILGYAPGRQLVVSDEVVGGLNGFQTYFKGELATIASHRENTWGSGSVLVEVTGYLSGSSTPVLTMKLDSMWENKSIHDAPIWCSLREGVTFGFAASRETLLARDGKQLAQREPSWRDSDKKAGIRARFHLNPEVSNQEAALYISLLRVLKTDLSLD